MSRRAMSPSELHAERVRRAQMNAHGPTWDHIPGDLPPLKPRLAPDEGPNATPASVQRLADRFAALGHHADAITALAHAANKAGLPFSVRQVPSWRRTNIGYGLVTIWETCASNDEALDPVDDRALELCRALLAHVLDDDAVHQPAVDLGPVLGALTCDQAARFAELATAFANGDIAVMFTNSGRMYLPQPPPAVDPF